MTETQEKTVPAFVVRLYYRYKRNDDDMIRNKLEKVKLVRLMNKGAGTVHGYYPYTDEAMKEILDHPRSTPNRFNVHPTKDEPLDLVPYKTIPFLVKSSSRFFLKDDIGEVFDAIEMEDLYDGRLKAIHVKDEYDELPGTEGEHFLMYAELLATK